MSTSTAHAAVASARSMRSQHEWPAIIGSLAGKALELAMQALLMLVVPRALGPSEYGRFAVALSLVMFGSAAVSIGGPTLMSRFVPEAPFNERPAVARALAIRVGRLRALQIAAAGVAATVLMVAAPGRFPVLVTLLVVGALVMDVAATLAFQIALALGRTTMWSFRYACQGALSGAAAIAGHAAAGLDGAVAGIFVGSLGALAWGSATVGGQLARAPAGAAIPAGALRFGVVQSVGSLFTQISHRGGVVAVALLAGSSVESASAGLAYAIALAGTYAVWQAFAVQLPSFVARRGSAADVEGCLTRFAFYAIAAITPLAVVGVALCEPGIRILLGDGFTGAAASVAVALAVLPLAPVSGIVNQASALRLRAGSRAIAQGAGALVFIVTVVLAVPAWGAAGASAALLAASVAAVLASVVALPGSLTRAVVVASLGGSGLVLACAVLFSAA